tara:strand:+ start:5738 stop:6109 length:372 start_codon:yes stop_codon:yes gene_type:complete
MTKEEQVETWNIEELIALTDEVQYGTVDYRGKDFSFQFCELVEAEEPKMIAVDDGLSEEEKMERYAKIGNDRITAMIEKANKKQPAKANIMKENWGMLPTSLRYKISNHIMGVESSDSENFTL